MPEVIMCNGDCRHIRLWSLLKTSSKFTHAHSVQEGKSPRISTSFASAEAHRV